MERRDFLKSLSAAGLRSMMDPAYLTAKEGLQSGQGPTDPVPKRQYGRAEDMISVIGFGGVVVKDVTPKEASNHVAEAEVAEVRSLQSALSFSCSCSAFNHSERSVIIVADDEDDSLGKLWII